MTIDALLKKISMAVLDASKTRLYGTLEVEFKNGEPVFLRRVATEKLDGCVKNAP